MKTPAPMVFAHRQEAYAVLDFEACSLSDACWSIEVGLSMLRDGNIETWSSLIRIEDDWDLNEWSDASAKIHGILIAELDYAPSAADVIRHLLAKVGGRIVLSDAPGYEQLWLNRLLDVIGRRDVMQIQDYHAVTTSLLLDSHSVDRAYAWLAHQSVLHRVGADAERLIAAWFHATGP